MSKPPPVKQTLVVPKGHEDDPGVLLALGQLQVRYGTENVELVIEEPNADAPSLEPPDLSPRRSIRVPPDADE